MSKLVLLRHGESEWNLKNLFTGWTDVDLTEAGVREAREAGQLLRKTDSSLISPEGRHVLIVAHGNSLRALVQHLDGLSNDEVLALNIPTDKPLVYTLDAGRSRGRAYL